MKCKDKEIIVNGMFYDDEKGTFCLKRLRCIVTNDELGRTLSIDDGKIQLSIPFEPIEKYLRKD